MSKKLYRSTKDKMIAGVCGGIGEYLELDATLIRLAFILLTFAGGGGVIAYIVCAIVVPECPSDYIYEKEKDVEVVDKDGNKVEVDPTDKEKKTKQLLGIGLLIVGAMLLFDNLFAWIDKGIIWAIAIIILGVFLLLKPSTK